MNSSSHKRGRGFDKLLLIGCAVVVVGFFLASGTVRWNEGARNPTTGSNAPSGVSVFFELKKSLDADSATSVRRAVFSLQDLAPFSTAFLLAPKRSLSLREEEILLEWVKSGGKLVLSFHDEKTHERLKKFLELAGINAFVGERPDFKQGRAVVTQVKRSHSFFVAGESYEFYSRLRFQDHECFIEPADCFLREGVLGKGGVVALSGLVPFANGLIGRKDNRSLAARFAVVTGRSAFNDYHLLVSEKTLSDFLTDPVIYLPAIGLLFGVLLFFTATGSEFEEHRLSAKPAREHRSFHDLNRQIVRAVSLEPGSMGAAARKQASFIERLVGPSLTASERADLEKITKSLTTEQHASLSDKSRGEVTKAMQLLTFHQNWLKSRRRT